MTPPLVLFLSGMLGMAYLVAGGFFLKFWRQTRDRLFLYFALAFGLLAVQRMLLVAEFSLLENQSWAYGIRLIAYLLIIYAIIAKNRKAAS